MPPSSEETSPPAARVRVSCRVRPALPTESTRCCTEITSVGGFRALQLNDPRGGKGSTVYKFDGLYTAASTQEDIFETEVSPLIQRAMKGSHGTVFAYGVTGSGKTHTMVGSAQQEGILIRSVKRLLHLLGEKNKTSCFRLWEDSNLDGSEPSLDVTFFEMHNNHCYDLFDGKQQETQLKDDGANPASLPGLTRVRIKTVEDFHRAFEAAQTSRTSSGSSSLGDRSSRSHSVLTLHLNYTEESKAVSGKINLIDLAGQEDNRKSGGQAARMAESSSINQSLCCLGSVLNAINSSSPRIPYRDSKLTRLLQDSLGGGSEAVMVICVAPHPKFYQDTLSTLTFACKARGVSTAAPEERREAAAPGAGAGAGAGGGCGRAGGAGGHGAGGAGPSFASMMSGPSQREGAGKDWRRGKEGTKKRKGEEAEAAASAQAKRAKAQAPHAAAAGPAVVKVEAGWGGAAHGVSAEDIVGGKQSELVSEFLRQSEALQLDCLQHRIDDPDAAMPERFFTPRRQSTLSACTPSPWAPMTPLSALMTHDGAALAEGSLCDKLLSTPTMRTPLQPRDPNASELRGSMLGGHTPGGAMGKGSELMRRAASLEAEGRVEEALGLLHEVLEALPELPGRAAVAGRVQAKMQELGGALKLSADELLGGVASLLSPERGLCGEEELQLSAEGACDDSLFSDLATVAGTPLRSILSPSKPATALPTPPSASQAPSLPAVAPSATSSTASAPAAPKATAGGGARRGVRDGRGSMALAHAAMAGQYARMVPPPMFGVAPCGMANAVLHRQLVDMLNTSSYARLCHLKGIGKQRAKKLVELRGAPEMGLGPPISHLEELKTIGMTSKQIDKFFMDNAPQMLFQHHR